MSAWFFNSANPSQDLPTFEDLLQACTSDLLPTPDISKPQEIDPDLLEKGLRLSDLIRSATVKPSEAVKSFRRRLASKNPNVQLRSLLTLDVAIKNSGDSFLKEVAGVGTSSSSGALPGVPGSNAKSNIVDELSELARASPNNDVRTTTLRLIQNWATAMQTKPALSISELVMLYSRLRSLGQPFPPISAEATASMISSMSAPSWSSDSDATLCERCRDPFTLTNRRHHCRNCGLLFDQKCSSKSMPLPHFGITTDVRVCDGCYRKIRSGRRASVDSPTSSRRDIPSRSSSFSSHLGSPKHSYSHSVGSAGVGRSSSYSATSALSRRNQEDEDLKLALRLSLAESGPSSSSANQSGYRPSYVSEPAGYLAGRQSGEGVTDSSALKHPAAGTNGVEDDPDLAAAIEASLREMQAQPSAPSFDAPAEHSYESGAVPTIKTLPSTDLLPTELDALLSFAQAAKLRPYDVNELTGPYERAEGARKGLVRGVRDSMGREQVLVETRDKLKEAMRLYEVLLDRQVSSHQIPQQQKPYAPQYHSQPVYSQAEPVQPQPQQSLYPSAYPTLDTAAQSYNSYAPQPQPLQQYEHAPQPQGQPQQPAYSTSSAPYQYQQTYEQPMEAYYAPPTEQAMSSAPPMSPSQEYASTSGAPYQQRQPHEEVSHQANHQPVHYQSQQELSRQPSVQRAAADSAQQHQHIVQKRQEQARQLANLPHAPQQNLYGYNAFPTVPDNEPEPAILETKAKAPEALLIDL